MIPYSDVQVFQRVEWEKVGMPPTEFLALTEKQQEAGIKCVGCNSEYRDWRGLTWQWVEQALAQEKALLTGVEHMLEATDTLAMSLTPGQEFHDLCTLVEGNEVTVDEKWGGDDLWFDLGITSITCAISAMRGAPVAYTRCKPSDNSDCPQVEFYIPKRIGQLISPYCEKHNCGLMNIELDCQTPEEGLVMWAQSVTPLLNLAGALYTTFHERDEELEELAKED